MVGRISNDAARFRQIIRGKIKEELKEYISRSEVIGKKGNDLVSIPVPNVNLPQFRFGSRGRGGVGQGNGKIGQPIGPGDPGEAGPGAGSDPSEHILEVDVTLDELAELLGEELELPNIEPKAKGSVTEDRRKYTTIRTVGPESLRHFKRTYTQGLRREMATGGYQVGKPVVIVKEDKRYRASETIEVPECNAVIIYMMDVSGSMGDEQKDIARITSFWIETWLKHHYKGLERVYITHDAKAREVDEDTFYHTRESGGTVISSAYNLANEIIDERFSPSEWNIYLIHFSDGDNYEKDTDNAIDLLEKEILPKSNLFCYGQTASYYGRGEFLGSLANYIEEEDKLRTSEIDEREDIMRAIKDFFGASEKARVAA